MTVSENDLLVGPVVPAAAVTLISIDFYFEAAADLEVYKSGESSPLTLGVDYTVALPSAAGAADGSITLTVAANGVDSYSILGRAPLARSSDIQFRGDLRSPVVNLELDRLWRALQAADTRASRAIRFSEVSDIPEPLNSETAAGRGGKLLGFSADGTELALATGLGSLIVPDTTVAGAVARWGGATGDELQSSLVRIDDDGNVTITSTGFLRIPVGTTAQRPGSPAAGDMRANTSLGVLEVYLGGAWLPLASLSAAQTFTGINTFGARVDLAHATEALLRFKAAADTTSLFQLAYDAAARAMLLAMRNAANDANVASIAFDEDGNIVIDADGNVNFTPTGELQYNGSEVATLADVSGWPYVDGITASGTTSLDFTGIPAGVTEIEVLLNLLSYSGTDNGLVQIGPSGGLETTGYFSSGERQSGGGQTTAGSTAGFIFLASAGTSTLGGSMRLVRGEGEDWHQTHSFSIDGSSLIGNGGGVKTLAGAVSRLSVIATGANTIDGGKVTVRAR